MFNILGFIEPVKSHTHLCERAYVKLLKSVKDYILYLYGLFKINTKQMLNNNFNNKSIAPLHK